MSEEPPGIDTSGPALIYVQIADRLAARIESGQLAPGSRLSAERDLAAEYGVAYDTIRRATALLRERGLIVTVHGRGTFVANSTS
jgi:GntR family transcriptional regulator